MKDVKTITTSENPFNPSFGKKPAVLLERQELVDRVARGIESMNGPYQTTLVYGLRGSGKTVLSSEVCSRFRTKKDWIVVNLASAKDIFPTILQSIYAQTTPKLQKAINKIGGIKVSLLGVELEYENKNRLEGTYQIVFEEILKRLAEKNISLLISIDEVSRSKELREFASIYQMMLREEYQIALIMTGLPKNISEVQNDKVLTFLLRSGRAELEPFDLFSVRDRFQTVFREGKRSVADDVLDEMTRMTAGYAYAFQLMGYLLWNTGDQTIDRSTVQSILPEYKTMLFRNAYTKIFEELSSKDREFVFAMAQTGESEVKVKSIREQCDMPANIASKYRQRLLDSQVIKPAAYGCISFTLPYFAEYALGVRRLYATE